MSRIELQILYKEGDVSKLRCTVNKWKFNDAMMGEQYLTFTITSEKPIDWAVGDFCVFRGETYTLNYVPSVTQKAGTKERQDSYTYENVKFESHQEELTRCIMLDITPTTGDYIASLGTNYTGSSRFQLFCGETSVNGSTLTAVCALAAKIQANLDRMFPTLGWKIHVNTTTTHVTGSGVTVLDTHTEDKIISFDNTTVASALAEVHSTFELDYCVRGRNIYIGYNLKNLTSDNDAEAFAFGYGRGYPTKESPNKALFQIKRIANSQQKIVTRLRALGSTKNMPYRYYNSKYNLSQSLFPTNLQLPDTFATPAVKATNNALRDSTLRAVKGDTNDAYIDKNDDAEHCAEGIREDSARWDGSNSSLPEIYPTIEGATYSELRNALVQDQDEKTGSVAFPGYGSTERIDKLLAIGYYNNGAIVDDANKGNGIMPESEISSTGIYRNANIGMTVLRYNNQNKGDFVAWGSNKYAGGEKILFSISGVSPGKYAMSPTNGLVLFGFSLGCHREGCSCDVGFRLAVKAKNAQTGVVATIATYESSYQNISRESGIYEIELPELPDVKEQSPQVTQIQVSALSDITVTFTPIIKNVIVPDGFTDDFSIGYQVGNSRLAPTVAYNPEYAWFPADDSDTLTGPFHVFIQDMGFDLQACWTNETPVVVMKSGRCVGREFEIGESIEKIEYDGKKGYMLTLNRAIDTNLNTYYPSETNPISAGDYFVLLNISMPDAYVKMAEVRLLRAATDYLADNCETQFTYQPYIDNIYLQRNIDNMEKAGTPEKSIFWRLYAGLKFTFRGVPASEDSPAPLADITIEKVTISMGEGLTPKVELVLNDDVQQTTIQKLTTSIDRIYNGSLFSSVGATSTASGAALMSILHSEGKKMFLSKVEDDAAGGAITFKRGLFAGGKDAYFDKNGNLVARSITSKGDVKIEKDIDVEGDARLEGDTQFGETFIDGFAAVGGTGAKVTKEGDGWFQNLHVAGMLEAMELRFNRVTAFAGINWHVVGGGKIMEVSEQREEDVEYVDTESGERLTRRVYRGHVKLKLEEGEMGLIAQDDICMGIWHNVGDRGSGISSSVNSETGITQLTDGHGNIVDEHGNAMTSSDDGRMNITRKGFFTCYFWITNVSNSTSSEFDYELRPGWPYHPQAGMDFAVYGSFTNIDRQSGAYQTTRYLRYLQGVNDWVLDGMRNIAMQLGDMTTLGRLSGDTASGTPAGSEITARGYSAYLDHIYMRGSIVQEDDAAISTIKDQMANYDVELSDYVGVLTVDVDGNIVGGLSTDVEWDTTEEDETTGESKTVHLVRKDWRVFTAITARKNGQTVLFPNLDGDGVERGEFHISAVGYGCSVYVDHAHSTVRITSIDNLKDGVASPSDSAWTDADYERMRQTKQCWVDIEINCEGRSVIERRMVVTLKHSTVSTVQADLTNSHGSISYSSKLLNWTGLPLSTDFSMWHGGELLPMTGVIIKVNGVPMTSNSGVYFYDSETYVLSIEVSDTNNVKHLTLSDINDLSSGSTVPSQLKFEITGSVKIAGVNYERTLVWTVDCLHDADIYDLVTNVPSVHQSWDSNGQGVLDVTSVECHISCTNSDGTWLMTKLQAATLGLYVKAVVYSSDGSSRTVMPDADGAEDESVDPHLCIAGIGVGDARVVFVLMKCGSYAANTDFPSDPIDAVATSEEESVPVIRDGENGATEEVENISTYYAANNSGTQHPTVPSGFPSTLGSWQATPPDYSASNQWLWTYTRITFANSAQIAELFSPVRMGIDGKGVVSQLTEYSALQSSGAVDASALTYSSFPSIDVNSDAGKWLFVRTTTTYSDNTTTVAYSCEQIGTGAYYVGSEEYYAVGESDVTPPSGYPGETNPQPQGQVFRVPVRNISEGSGQHTEDWPKVAGPDVTLYYDPNVWTAVRPPYDPQSGKIYLWNFEVSRDSHGNRYLTYPQCIANLSRGIAAVIEAYGISASGDKNSQTGVPAGTVYDGSGNAGWIDERGSIKPTETLPYLWNKTVTVYNDSKKIYVDFENNPDDWTWDETTCDVNYHVIGNYASDAVSYQLTLSPRVLSASPDGVIDSGQTVEIKAWRSKGNDVTQVVRLIDASRLRQSGELYMQVWDEDLLQWVDLQPADARNFIGTQCEFTPAAGATVAPKFRLLKCGVTAVQDTVLTETGVMGIQRKGDTGNGYAGLTEFYAVGANESDVPDGCPQAGTYGSYSAFADCLNHAGGVSSGAVLTPARWGTGTPRYTQGSGYLWNFEVSVWTDGSVDVTPALCIGNLSKGINTVTEYYALSAYGAPDSGGSYPSDIGNPADGDEEEDDFTEPGWWSEDITGRAPTDALPYQWNWTRTEYSDGTSRDVYHVSGVKGTPGTDGASVIAQYCADGSPQQDGDIHDSWKQSDRYMRTRTSNEQFSGLTDSSHPWHLIVGENGADGKNGDYSIISFGRSSQLSVSSGGSPSVDQSVGSVTINGTEMVGWCDAPVATTDTCPYLWEMTVRVTHDASTGVATYGSPQYFRVTGEQGPKGADGSDGVTLHLTNQEDSLQYDGSDMSKVNSNDYVETTAELLVGGVAANGVTFVIYAYLGCVAELRNASNDRVVGRSATVRVTDMSAMSGYVDIAANYGGENYIGRFSVKKLVGQDKYELDLSKTRLTYNTSTNRFGNGEQSETVTILVRHTKSDGTQASAVVAANLGLALNFGGRSGVVAVNAAAGTYQISGLSNVDVVLHASCDTSKVYDRQTIDIATVANGSVDNISVLEWQHTYYKLFKDKQDSFSIGEFSAENYPESSGWMADLLQMPDAEWRYLYAFKARKYSNEANAQCSATRLVWEYRGSVRPNLLKQTAFTSEDEMDAWSGRGSMWRTAFDSETFANCVRHEEQYYYIGTEDGQHPYDEDHNGMPYEDSSFPGVTVHRPLEEGIVEQFGRHLFRYKKANKFFRLGTTQSKTQQYCLSSSAIALANNTGWQTTIPQPTTDRPFVWTREIYSYKYNSSDASQVDGTIYDYSPQLGRNNQGAIYKDGVDGVNTLRHLLALSYSQVKWMRVLMQELAGELKNDTWYCLSFWTCGRGLLEIALKDVVTPSADSSKTFTAYLDGVVSETSNGGSTTQQRAVLWLDGDTESRKWHYHFVTFKTGTLSDKPYFALTFLNRDSQQQAGSSASDRYDIRLCQLKLEEGEDPTSWGEHADDSAGRLDVRYIPYGQWERQTLYERKNKEVPYVDHDGQFYYLKTRSSYGSSQEPGTTQGDTYWALMNHMRPILSNGVIADYARLSSAVFCGDWMYSQHGRIYDGTQWTDIGSSQPNYGGKAGYAWFEPSDPTGAGGTASHPHFAPAWCVDLLTGTMHAAAGNFKVSRDGSVEVQNATVRGSLLYDKVYAAMSVHSGNSPWRTTAYDEAIAVADSNGYVISAKMKANKFLLRNIGFGTNGEQSSTNYAELLLPPAESVLGMSIKIVHYNRAMDGSGNVGRSRIVVVNDRGLEDNDLCPLTKFYDPFHSNYCSEIVLCPWNKTAGELAGMDITEQIVSVIELTAAEGPEFNAGSTTGMQYNYVWYVTDIKYTAKHQVTNA